jgi:hypothetical protein
MPNVVMLDGVVQAVWTYGGGLFARIVHYEPDGSRGYYNLAFPKDAPVTARETDNQGTATQRRIQISEHNRDRIDRGAVVTITGRLNHRDERVSLHDFLNRAPGGEQLSGEAQQQVAALADQVGEENRSIVEITVEEVIYL